MPDNSEPSRPASLLHRLRQRFGTGGMALLVVMVLMLVSAIAYAIEGEKPWGRTVQRRIAKNEALKPPEHAVIGLWWAAVANAGVLAALLGTAGMWMPKPKSSVISHQSSVVDPGRAGAVRWMWALLLGAVLFGTWERWPKLTQSFWNDEAYALHRFVSGTWDRQEDGAVVFEPVTWTDTLFENRNGNNHIFNSLVSRVTLDAWRAATGASPEAFDEAMARLPQFLAGLGTIVLMFLLGREMGSPLAGAGAAWLLALHPWHIRYAVEMRGYSMMLFFLALALLALARALRTHELRWWLWFCVGEALFLLSFPGSLYVAFAINLTCTTGLLLRREWGTFGHLAAFNTLAAVPVLQIMLPSVPQIRSWLKEHLPAYVTDVWLWLHDLAATLAVGWQFDNPWREAHVGTDWQGVAANFPIPPVALALVLAGLFLTGLVLAFLRGTAGRIIVLAPVLAALLSLAVNLRPGTPMTVWYLIFLLIPATLAVHLTLEWAGRWTQLRWLPLALCASFNILYAVGTAPAVESLREHSRQPIRETVAYIRTQSRDAMTATFGISDRQHSVYDPRVEVLASAADLENCILRSRAAAQPLYVYFCSDEHGQKRNPDIYARVVRSGEFEKLAEFPASEELFSYRVYRLKPVP